MTAATCCSLQPRSLQRADERGVVLGPGEALDPLARLQPGRREAVLRLGWRRHRLPDAAGEVASEADPLVAHQVGCVLEVVDRACDRAVGRIDRERMEHEAEQPSCRGERAELVVVQVARCVVQRATPAVRVEHRGAAGTLEHLGERAAGRVREIEHDAEPDESVDELATEPRQAAALLRGAVREGIAAVPGEADHADAELVKDVGRPRLDAELLDALQREHEPDPLAGLDRVEVGRRAHVGDPLPVLAERAVERGDLPERLAQRALGLHGDVDVDRAHLQPDTARLELRQPRTREDVALAEPVLAVGELEQEIGVRVGDHVGDPRGRLRRTSRRVAEPAGRRLPPRAASATGPALIWRRRTMVSNVTANRRISPVTMKIVPVE